jgi:hypothetical protein
LGLGEIGVKEDERIGVDCDQSVTRPHHGTPGDASMFEIR